MNNVFSKKINIIYYFSILAVMILGFLVGEITRSLDKIEPVIKGILGATTIFLLYILFVVPDKPIGVSELDNLEIDYQLILRHCILFFIVFIIFNWSIHYVIDAVRFIIATV